jgi:hypothetical protein
MALTSRPRTTDRLFVARRFARAVLFAALWGSAAARAGDDPAQQLFNQGVEAARQNHWSDAREAFERAYRLSARPVVLINLAAAEVHTGRLKEAAGDYRRILQGTPSTETVPFRKAASDVLPSLEARIPRIRLHTSGLTATDVVEIDGDQVPSGQIEEPHLVDPGAHVVVIARSGVERVRVSFSVAEGESHEISVPAPPNPVNLNAPEILPPFVPGADLETSRSSPSASRGRRSFWRSPWFWTAVAAGLAGGTVATVLVIRNRDQAFSGNLSPGSYTVQ